jgi:hypothetical protein
MAKADELNTSSPNTDNMPNTGSPNTDNVPNNDSEPNNDSKILCKEPTTNDCASPDTILSLKIPDAEDYIMAERLSN